MQLHAELDGKANKASVLAALHLKASKKRVEALSHDVNNAIAEAVDRCTAVRQDAKQAVAAAIAARPGDSQFAPMDVVRGIDAKLSHAMGSLEGEQGLEFPPRTAGCLFGCCQ